MNTSYQGVSDDQLKGLINDNPKLWFYQAMYGIIIVVMIVTGFFLFKADDITGESL